MSSDRPRILVINPNSSTSVTEAIGRSLEGFGGAQGPRFDCRTIAEGPATIVTDGDVCEAGERVAALAASEPGVAAVIVACFSDPGLTETRARVSCPVIGVQQASVMTALSLADRFGIIALSTTPIPRHARKLGDWGVLPRLAKEVGLSGVSAHAAGHDPAIYPELLDAGRQIVAAGGGAIVLGCAGFGPRVARLEADLGVPVIDPVMAAAAMVLPLAGR